MNKGVVIFIEGDTEEEIYNKFINKLHSKTINGCFSVEKLIIRNLKGIGNYKKRAVRVFTKHIIPKNPGLEFDIFLCYDSDVFDDFAARPPVKWKDVEKALKGVGAKRIFHIKSIKSIEDWMLKDINGLCKYLKLPTSTKLKGKNGLEKLKNLFSKSNKVYVKGAKIKGLVDALDIEEVMCKHCMQLNPLCKKLGIKCNEE